MWEPDVHLPNAHPVFIGGLLSVEQYSDCLSHSLSCQLEFFCSNPSLWFRVPRPWVRGQRFRAHWRWTSGRWVRWPWKGRASPARISVRHWRARSLNISGWHRWVWLVHSRVWWDVWTRSAHASALESSTWSVCHVSAKHRTSTPHGLTPWAQTPALPSPATLSSATPKSACPFSPHARASFAYTAFFANRRSLSLHDRWLLRTIGSCFSCFRSAG